MHRLPLLLGFTLALAACGSAQFITRTDDGGVLELEGPRGSANSQAGELMRARCGGPYTVTYEGDEFIDGKTRYRVHFRCGGDDVDGGAPREDARY